MRHQVKHKLNLAQNQYLEDILGISRTKNVEEPGKSSHTAKKLYTMLKRSKLTLEVYLSYAGMASFILIHCYKDNADILNIRFQSACSDSNSGPDGCW